MKIGIIFLLLFLVGCQVKETTSSGAVISGHLPTSAIFSVSTPLNTSYASTSIIPFTLTFPKTVTVTGSPRLLLNIGGTIRYADFVSGSGSSALLFHYTVQAGENDSDGIGLSSTIDLNGGSLKYDANNCNTTITPPNLSTVLVDSEAPTIILSTVPSNGTYISGAVLNFSFKFSEKVTVTGTPKLPINLTSGSINANYFSGSGSDTLLFRYTVSSSDVDVDGISLQSLNLNSGTIQDVVLLNADLNYVSPNTTAIFLAGNTPAISSITLPAAGRYTTGQNVDFTVNFDQSVFVTLTPRLAITTSAGTVYANFLSGGGTNALVFRYTVASGDYDTDGIALVSPLETNGGAIQNITMTSNAQLNFTPPSASSITVDGLDPVITSITAPTSKWYLLAENLDFTVNYSTSVVVTGVPKLSLVVGSSSVVANYLSGSGTSALKFRYTAISTNLDTDGVQTTSPLLLSTGNIKDSFGDSAGLSFTPTSNPGVLVDTISPAISSVSGPASGSYTNTQNLNFSFVFSENVTVTGTPSINLMIGATSKAAAYVSGSGTNTLIFRYSVASGDLDNDGITSSSPILLNAGTIKDTAGNTLSGLTFTPPSTLGVLVDGTLASISSITPPTAGTYKTASNVDFVANFSKSVNVTGSPKLVLDVGGATVYANYLSGSATSSLTFRYVVQAGNKDLNGLAVTSPIDLTSGTITDSSANNATVTFTAPNTSSVLIDGIDLVISSITPPADKIYANTETLDFTINYNNTAIVSGTPRLQLAVGVVNQYATYVSGSGSSALVFRYTVGATDIDTDGVTTLGSNLDLNSGTIKDEFADNADLAFIATNYPNKKVDGESPTIASVSAPTSGTYAEAENINFTVTTSEDVNVTGSPRISLTVGSTARYATYISGSGTSVLIFRYTVAFSDLDNDGIVNASPLDLNAGTIKDLAGNSLSPLTFTPANSSGVLINGVAPIITSVTPPSNATYATSANLDFIVNYSSNVDVVGSPKLSLDIGGASVQATYLSGSGSSALTFRYTIIVGESDANGIAISSPLTLNGGTIKNSSLTNASLTFTSPSTASVLVDGVDIVISTITPPADGTYKIGADLDFTVNYNYAATVTGAPRLQLTVGASTLYATYISGSATSAHLFRYTVASGELDSDGISTVGPALDLNGATVKDSFGDNANLNFTGTNYPNKKVDGIRPTVSSMIVSANKTYLSGENIDFTATYSEAVTITGSPRLSLTVGITSRFATYVSGSGTNTIIFRHTVEVGDEDNDGITVATLIDLNSGTISDSPGNTQTNLSFTPPTLTGILVGGVSPTILSIDAPASQTYMLGAQLNFTVNFSENVTITGTPTLSLNVGGTAVLASYLSGSGTSAIVFSYTTLVNHYDGDGVATVSPVALAGGTIKSTASSSNAILTFTGSTKVGVLVDAVLPKITSITLPANLSYQNGHGTPARQYLQFTVNTDKAVTVTGTPRLVLTIGPNSAAYATYVSAGSTSTALIFKYTLLSSDIDFDGIEFGNSNNLDFNGGTIKGTAVANDLDPALGTNVMTKIFVVPTAIRAWYDVSDTSYRTGHAGAPTTRLIGLKDKVGTYDLTATGIDYAQTGFNSTTNAFLKCASTTSGAFLTSTSALRPSGIITAFKAPTAIPSVFFGNSGADNVMLQFRTATTLRCGNAQPYCQVYSSTSGTGWTNNSFVMDYNGKFTLSQYGALAVKWEWTTFPSSNQPYNLCAMTSGEIPEVILLNQTAISTTQLTHIRSYFQARYGFTFNN